MPNGKKGMLEDKASSEKGDGMSLKQAVYDRIRGLNKHVTNRILIHIAGRKFGHFVILHHTGRKTGKEYAIPVIAEPTADGFVIAQTYGLETDWRKNVEAADGCRIRWKKQDYLLIRPRLIPREEGLQAFPAVLRSMLRFARIEYFLHLTKP
jgi:deazaflavin-dependent oxidoreductase (nitroreductase family)